MAALYRVVEYKGRPKIPKMLNLKKRKNRFVFRQSSQIAQHCMLYEYGRGEGAIHVVAYVHTEEEYSEMVFLIEENELTKDFYIHLNEPYYEINRELYLDIDNQEEVLRQAESLFAEEEYPDENDFLHIYGQRFWHDAGFVVGDKASLTKLKKAIEVALEHEESKVTMSPSDGEGFDLYIKCMSDDDDWEVLASPYHEEMPYFEEAKESHPRNVFKKYKRLL